MKNIMIAAVAMAALALVACGGTEPAPVDAPVQSAPSTATPTEVVTPDPTATPEPTPEIDLGTTTKAALWLNFYTGDYGVEVTAQPVVDLSAFDLEVVATIGGQSFTYCNASFIPKSETSGELGCTTARDLRHTQVSRVYALIGGIPMRCEKNNLSNSSATVFACVVR